jgi:hypothetical protein
MKKAEMKKTCSTYERGRGAYRVFVGKPEGRRSLGRLRHRWRVILKCILEKWMEGTDWIDLAEDRDR